MSRFQHPDPLAAEAFDDGLVVYLPAARSLHHLDQTAALLWSALQQEGLEDVLEASVSAHPENPAAVRDDVLALVRQLVQTGLLEVVPEPPERDR